MNDRPPDRRRYRAPAPRHGTIVCDVDGTLARRRQPIGQRMTEALADAAAAGWKIFILTGQPFGNIEPRVASQLRASFRRVPGALNALRILTCEGANEWRIRTDTPSGFAFSRRVVIHPPVRDRIGVVRLLRSRLRTLLPPKTRLLQPPLWLEEAMCIIKTDANLEQRRLLAERLVALFHQHKLGTLRVGLGGTFSIVITHCRNHKGWALERIVHSMAPGQRTFYLADEFTESGNDAAALQVDDLVCVDFSGSVWSGSHKLWPGGGSGPRAVRRWLRRLMASPLNPPTRESFCQIFENKS